MSKEEAVANICRLAVNYKTVGSKSINDWVKDSGWLSFKNNISSEDIKIFLKSTPALIDSWLGYSEDKRCAGWYFKPSEMNGYYTVGHYDTNSGVTNETKYRDSAEACSVFIMNEFK